MTTMMIIMVMDININMGTSIMDTSMDTNMVFRKNFKKPDKVKII